jgi:hypothetical protein
LLEAGRLELKNPNVLFEVPKVLDAALEVVPW